MKAMRKARFFGVNIVLCFGIVIISMAILEDFKSIYFISCAYIIAMDFIMRFIKCEDIGELEKNINIILIPIYLITFSIVIQQSSTIDYKYFLLEMLSVSTNIDINLSDIPQ